MKQLFYLLIIFLLSSCGAPIYPGFSEIAPDLYYQRLQLGEGIVYHPDSCFLDYSVSFYPLNEENKRISKAIKFAQLNSDLLKDSLQNNAKEGDEITFISTRHSVYLNELCKAKPINDTAVYVIDFHIDKVYNLYRQSEDPNVKEFKKIEKFFKFSSDQEAYRYYNGIWIKNMTNNDISTKNVSGDIVLDYAGYSLDGEAWDIPDFPLKFNLKDQYQVVRGIELALQKMHFGDSVEVIIPSYLAFGELGSKNGNIPPYEAIVYHLKAYDAKSYIYP